MYLPTIITHMANAVVPRRYQQRDRRAAVGAIMNRIRRWHNAIIAQTRLRLAVALSQWTCVKQNNEDDVRANSYSLTVWLT